MSKELLQEVATITANAVSKKQDAAKLNFPKLVERIKSAAELGESECIIPLHQMNEFDKKLLEQEGFIVKLQSVEIDYGSIASYKQQLGKHESKEWVIKW